jgi:sigma-B regulation protein RsbU (phosphoserine phosphatase)
MIGPVLPQGVAGDMGSAKKRTYKNRQFMKIMAVDDDPVALTVLEDTLKLLGHEVVTAYDGESAWSLMHAEGIRLMVCDWNMPKLDGLGLCQRIRSQPPGDYVYFILLTGAEASNIHRDKAMSAGVDDFLSKPVDMDELKIRLHVAQRILQFTTHIQKLESLIPICSYCKNVRDDQSYWKRIESYLGEITGASCSHSVCPECYKKHIVPQFEELGITNYPSELKLTHPQANRVP